jgi:hypothetical protein
MCDTEVNYCGSSQAVNEWVATTDLNAIVALRMDGKDTINDAFGIRLFTVELGT